VNAVVEAQSCGLGLAMNKISIGPNLPTISFYYYVSLYKCHLSELLNIHRVFLISNFAVQSAHGINVEWDRNGSTSLYISFKDLPLLHLYLQISRGKLQPCLVVTV
jgi:hypothetical protein